MYKTIKIIVIAFYLMCVSIGISTATEIQVSVSPKMIGPVNPYLYGFGGVDLRFCDARDSGFLTPALSLKPNVLRFPFGQLGNFYHWKNSGYGLKKEEIDRVKGAVYRSVSKYFRAYQTAHLKNMVDQFIQYDKAGGSKVLLIANILTGNRNEILELIAKFRENKIDIAGIELGNELYLGAYREEVPNVARYILIAKRFARAIRQAYPDIKLAVTAAPASSFERRRGPNQLNYFSQWNTALSREDFYDAVVIHSYKSFDSCEDYSAVRDKFACAAGGAETFVNSDLDSEIGYYVNIFGRKRKLWLTEWNMKKPGHLGNTMFHAFFAAKFLLELTEAKFGDAVDIATYWCLCEKNFGYPLITPYRISEKIGEGFQYEKKPAYYSFLLLKDIFNVGVMRVRSVVNGIGRSGNPKVFSFLDSLNSYLYVYTINETKETYFLKLMLEKGLRAEGSPWQYAVIKGDALSAGIGKTGSSNGENGGAAFITGSTTNGLQTIPPFSFGYLKLRVKVQK